MSDTPYSSRLSDEVRQVFSSAFMRRGPKGDDTPRQMVGAISIVNGCDRDPKLSDVLRRIASKQVWTDHEIRRWLSSGADFAQHLRQIELARILHEDALLEDSGVLRPAVPKDEQCIRCERPAVRYSYGNCMLHATDYPEVMYVHIDSI